LGGLLISLKEGDRMVFTTLGELKYDKVHRTRKRIESLIGLAHKKNASLVVIRGRRRIGKSRVTEQYTKKFKKAIILSGILPVDGVTAEDQREEFLRQLQEDKLPIHRSDYWGNLFFDLTQNTKKDTYSLF
jgi:predicted AAA+ superfamily ATPase